MLGSLDFSLLLKKKKKAKYENSSGMTTVVASDPFSIKSLTAIA